MTQDNPTPDPYEPKPVDPAPVTPPPGGTVPPAGGTVPPTTDYASSTTPPPGGVFSPPPVPTTPVPQEQRQFGMIAHLLALAGLVVPTANVIAPLIFWAMKKQESAFLDDQGKESINFQITVTLAIIVLTPTLCIGIGAALIPAVGIAALVFTIIAAIKANEGVYYRYPFSMRLIK